MNVRSMNQGKLEVVKQEIARANINILGIRELKWTGMGEFNSDDHYIYYCGQESLRRNGIAITETKESKMQSCMQSQTDRMISVPFQGVTWYCPNRRGRGGGMFKREETFWEFNLVFCQKLGLGVGVGWAGGSRGGDICITDDLCCCMAETNTIL